MGAVCLLELQMRGSATGAALARTRAEWVEFHGFTGAPPTIHQPALS